MQLLLLYMLYNFTALALRESVLKVWWFRSLLASASYCDEMAAEPPNLCTCSQSKCAIWRAGEWQPHPGLVDPTPLLEHCHLHAAAHVADGQPRSAGVRQIGCKEHMSCSVRHILLLQTTTS